MSVIRIKPWLLAPGSVVRIGRGGGCYITAKPSGNIYLGNPTATGLDSVSAAIANLASHGEMGIASIHEKDNCLSAKAMALIDLVSHSIEFIDEKTGTRKIGAKKGKFLHHFGFRKQVMNLSPESLLDHAWIACALSYSVLPVEGFICPSGGGISGGIAARIKQDGLIFRGSAVADQQATCLISAENALEVSLLANGFSLERIESTAEVQTPEQFLHHRFFAECFGKMK